MPETAFGEPALRNTVKVSCCQLMFWFPYWGNTASVPVMTSLRDGGTSEEQVCEWAVSILDSIL